MNLYGADANLRASKANRRAGADMGRISKLIDRLGLSRKPKCEVRTRAGVMIRECVRAQRIQFRDCGTKRWVELESPDEVARPIGASRRVSLQSPAWVQNLQPAPAEVRRDLPAAGTHAPKSPAFSKAQSDRKGSAPRTDFDAS